MAYRPLSFYKQYKAYDSNGSYRGTIETLLIRTMNEPETLVKKVKTDKGPHYFVKVAETDEVYKWVLSNGYDIQFEDKGEGKLYSDKKLELFRQGKLLNVIAQLKLKVEELEKAKGIPPLDILKTKKEILLLSQKVETYCGIYFLINDKYEIVYVGQSINIHGRIGQHLLEGTKEFSRFAYISCHKEKLNTLEALYIKFFKPKYNVSMPITSHELSSICQKLSKKQMNKSLILNERR